MADMEKRREEPVFRPCLDIAERGENYEVWADMPGVDPESVDVSVDGNMMTIRGEAKHPEIGDLPPIHREYRVGDYEVHLRLSQEIDREDIGAELKDGQLKITMKKSEKAKPKQVQVRAA